MPPMNEATRRQLSAANPKTSTWLSANAGSGKTRVLTDRVARLLLDGVEPQHILCLTYTKAAASEMQNRLFARLGDWAMLEDDKLRTALIDLGVEQEPDSQRLKAARTLFARAIETPGGLKIQTIHSFCASLLRRFPLEANVSPQFTEIEERAADLLRAEIVDQMASAADQEPIRAIAKQYNGEDFLNLTKGIVGMRDTFRKALSIKDAYALFDLAQDIDASVIQSLAFQGGERELLDHLIPILIDKGGNDAKAGLKLKQLHALDLSALPVLESVFLTGADAKSPFSAKTDSFPTKPTKARIETQLPALQAFMLRIEDVREKRLALQSAENTFVLYQFAHEFVARYEQAMIQRGWLDFDDLILKARQLLNDEKVAAWVLFRIDGGIDHILVDEAQDTSPAQWDVIRKLAEEFSSGQGARQDVLRTLFVVGDKKQSIYSFQGADPREFDRMQQEFNDKFAAINAPFQETTLDFSFRSSSAILRLVDQVFDQRVEAGFPQNSKHIAFKSDLPGRVDLWPLVPKTQELDDREWFDPVDQRSEKHHNVILADQIAHNIEQMIKNKHLLPTQAPDGSQAMRPVSAGDFLILVQRRTGIFPDIIRACKAYNLPIAGADRLRVGGELAVRDLGVLLSFLATQDDSLSLATVLRSPLFGWSEQDLFDLAHRRTQSHLWQALRAREQEFPETMRILQDLRDHADFLRPYDLIDRILTRHGGRQKLLARLGSEAEDGIDALLSQALAYERTAIPSLTGFIVWMKADNLEIKRQIDSASDQIRVMTVHGAKGLEAPIVILPETTKHNQNIRSEVIKMNGQPVWKASKENMPAMMRESMNQIKETTQHERLRQLYVALTRAEKWLIVAGAGDLGSDGTAWYQIIENAMKHANAVTTSVPLIGEITRLEYGDWTAQTLPQTAQETPIAPVLEPWFSQAHSAPEQATKTISPSNFEGSKALAGDLGLDEESAKAYGSLVHWHLEHPEKKNAPHFSLAAPLLQQAQKEAHDVLNDPQLADIFAPNSLAEVSISAPTALGRIHGTIDRLIIENKTVLAIDFKTNRVVPKTAQSCPLGVLRQMGAYHLALAHIYPDHEISLAILWTNKKCLMPLPNDLVLKSLEAVMDTQGDGVRHAHLTSAPM